MRIEISVQGIDDAEIVARIDAAVRTSLGRQPWPGTWRVTIAPSRAAGRWDLRIHGPAGRHVLSLAVPPRLLADLIPRRLDESLNHAVASVLETAAGGKVRRVPQEVDQLRKGPAVMPSVAPLKQAG